MSPPYTTWLIGALALFLVGLAWWRVRQALQKRRQKPALEVIEPGRGRTRTISDLLSELSASAATDVANRREHFNRLAIIVRLYLQALTGLSATRMTTMEVIDALSRPGPASIDSALTSALLQACDRARFASWPPNEEAWRECLARSFELVTLCGDIALNASLVRESLLPERAVGAGPR